MMNKKRIGVFTAMMVAFALLLGAGCGQPSAPPSSSAGQKEGGFTPSLDTSTNCKITIAGSYKNFEALEDEFIRFNKYYPNVKLEFSTLDSYKKNIETILKSDDAPNIYFVYPWMLGRDDCKNAMESAENLEDPSLKIDLSSVRNGLLCRNEKNECIMLPVFDTTYGMLVNEKIFKDNGLDIPTTYEGLLDTCAKLKGKGFKTPLLAYMPDQTYNLYTMFYPHLCAELVKQPGSVEALNDHKEGSGKYLKSTLELLDSFWKEKIIDPADSESISDNYNAMILRFFEGDIPMMLATGDTVSGTSKRESQSEKFSKEPFTYSFHPVPTNSTGGYFLIINSLSLAVNKNCKNLDMTNEFMRFLAGRDELNNISKIKRLMTVTQDLALDGIYEAFGKVSAENTLSSMEVGLSDKCVIEFRDAMAVITEKSGSVEDAVKKFEGSNP